MGPTSTTNIHVATLDLKKLVTSSSTKTSAIQSNSLDIEMDKDDNRLGSESPDDSLKSVNNDGSHDEDSGGETTDDNNNNNNIDIDTKMELDRDNTDTKPCRSVGVTNRILSSANATTTTQAPSSTTIIATTSTPPTTTPTATTTTSTIKRERNQSNSTISSLSNEPTQCINEDFGSWECDLCTYRNSAERFKCEMCDFRRGTSTRKPRCNVDTIVAQVVKQQEQIRQQTRAKPTKSRQSSSSINNNIATSSASNSDAPTTPVPKSTSTKASKTSVSKPLEVVGNLIKYQPPTSTGRTGLIIDKKKFTQHSVTVNDVTITFTEFATRQNNYVRKKKKKNRCI